MLSTNPNTTFAAKKEADSFKETRKETRAKFEQFLSHFSAHEQSLEANMNKLYQLSVEHTHEQGLNGKPIKHNYLVGLNTAAANMLKEIDGLYRRMKTGNLSKSYLYQIRGWLKADPNKACVEKCVKQINQGFPAANPQIKEAAQTLTDKIFTNYIASKKLLEDYLEVLQHDLDAKAQQFFHPSSSFVENYFSKMNLGSSVKPASLKRMA